VVSHPFRKESPTTKTCPRGPRRSAARMGTQISAISSGQMPRPASLRQTICATPHRAPSPRERAEPQSARGACHWRGLSCAGAGQGQIFAGRNRFTVGTFPPISVCARAKMARANRTRRPIRSNHVVQARHCAVSPIVRPVRRSRWRACIGQFDGGGGRADLIIHNLEESRSRPRRSMVRRKLLRRNHIPNWYGR